MRLDKCNKQLPLSIDSFMVSRELIKWSAVLLLEKNYPDSRLYIQSNVEDVAVSINTIIERLKLQDLSDISPCRRLSMPLVDTSKYSGSSIFEHCMCSSICFFNACCCLHDDNIQNDSVKGTDVDEPTRGPDLDSCTTSTLTKRQVKWLDAGGVRAVGQGWLQNSCLPDLGKTETEAMCLFTELRFQ